MAAHAGTYPWSNTGDSTWDTPETVFRAHSGRSPKRGKLLAKAESAFDSSKPDSGQIAEIDGCGHIDYLEYALKEHVLKVTFGDGAIVVYDNIPEAIAGELFHHAETKQTTQSYVDGTYRHLLGIRFWDLIRIRGRKYGARKPFEYVARSPYKLTRSSSRYRVKLTEDNFKALFPDKAALLRDRAGHLPKPGEIIETVLNKEEYNQILAQLENETYDAIRAADQQSHLSMGYLGKGDAAGKGIDAELYGLSDERDSPEWQLFHEMERSSRIRPETEYSYQDRSQLMDYIKNGFDKKLEEFRTTDEVAAAIRSAMIFESEKDALRRVLRQFGRNDLLKMIDWRTKDTLMKSGYGDRWLAGMLNALDGPHSYGNWKKENEAHRYAQRHTGTGWTKQQLKDFANHTVPGNIDERHAKRYKDYIRMQDWEGALDFLKNHKPRMTMNGPGGGQSAYPNAYAMPQDFVDFEKE